MDRADVARWLDDYVEAWKSYDRDRIAALFAEDVEYRYHPYDEPVSGRDAVVESWLGQGDHVGASARDDEGTYDASYAPVAVDGDLAVATGSSTYFERPGGPIDRVYDNCIVMRFDAEGRCREYSEWYMKRPGT
jgi:ketosteroid isomerase-like protein